MSDAAAPAAPLPGPPLPTGPRGPLRLDPPARGDPREGPGDLFRRIVALCNLYRLLLPPLLYGILMATRPTPSVGGTHPQAFIFICILYWAFGGVFAFGGWGRWASLRMLVLADTLLDTAAISALLYCSGGVASGLGILLVIPVGAMALLAQDSGALMVAAIAALGLLGQQILAVTTGNAPSGDYPVAGILGAVVFLVALTAWPVARRLRESEAQVRRAELDIANLAQLS